MSTLLSIIVFGFFLGMRHATDPDHVLAITTIVSRQRSVRHAAVIGVLWGIGHTVTVLAVGSAIILFGLAIPPRIGLAMEASVGLMLILLGALNLSGMLRWIAGAFAHVHSANHHSETDAHNPDSAGHLHEGVWGQDTNREYATPVGRMERIFGKLG